MCGLAMCCVKRWGKNRDRKKLTCLRALALRSGRQAEGSAVRGSAVDALTLFVFAFKSDFGHRLGLWIQ